MFRRWGWNALKWGSDTLRERIRLYWICLSYQNANVNFFARAVSSKGEASKWHSRSSKIVSLRLRWMKSWQRWKVMWVSFNHQAITFLGLSLLILWLQPDSDWSVIYVSLFHAPLSILFALLFDFPFGNVSQLWLRFTMAMTRSCHWLYHQAACTWRFS